jgi:hypothetical protein
LAEVETAETKKKKKKGQLTVMTIKAVRAPDNTVDLGCRIAIRAAIIKVSSPI